MTLSADEKKKQSMRYDSRYRFYRAMDKILGIMIWAVPLVMIVAKVGGHLLGGTQAQSHEYPALVITCVGYAIIFLGGKLLFKTLVNVFTGGFTQDNVNERITITDDGVVIYSHNGRNGKDTVNERIFPDKAGTDETASCVLFLGRIEVLQTSPKGETIRKPDKSRIVLYDYYTPSLIEAVKQFQD